MGRLALYLDFLIFSDAMQRLGGRRRKATTPRMPVR